MFILNPYRYAVSGGAYSGPTVVGVGTAASGASAISPALPGSTLQDDILVLFLETFSNQAITVAGWTEAGSSPQFTNDTVGTRLTVFWKRAGSSESAPTTSDSGDHQVGQIIAIRGCVATGDPFDVTGGSFSNTTSLNHNIPGVTTTMNNCLVLVAIGMSQDLSTTTTASGWSNSNLANLTEQMDQTFSINLGGGFAVATGEMATAGATGTTAVTLANSQGATYWSGALKP
jgi:hypothetical protein